MKIRYLNGIRLKRAIIAGSEFVIRARDHLDRINVFPVADADTGTNMASTMQHIADAAERCDNPSIEAVGNVVAESALDGARGNSGAILAQFFQGLTEELKGKWRITTRAFGAAALKASERAREAIAAPKEGTIITVMKDWATHVHHHSHHKSDFVDLLRDSLKEARRSLAETPKKLEVLAKAGVVDAGAQGFVHLLEGVVHFIESGRTRGKVMRRRLARRLRMVQPHENAPNLTYRYCTECLIVGEGIDRTELRRTLGSLGDSLIVVGGRHKTRVHIHTDEPERVFETLSPFGEVGDRKVDDMKRQGMTAIVQKKGRGIALVTDSSCDLPQEFIDEHNITVVPLTLRFGSEAFLDKVEMTPVQFYDRLATSHERPTTSQPAPGDFAKMYRKAIELHESIIAVHLSGALSGTLQSARTAAEKLCDPSPTVIDGKNASIGLGLILQEAVQAINEGLDHEGVVERIRLAANNVRIFLAVPTLKYLIRSGRVSKMKGWVANLVNLKPIITLDSEGKAAEAGRTFGGSGAFKKVLRLAEQYGRRFENRRFAVAHASAPQAAEWLASRIKDRFGLKDIWVLEASPALGLHVGPGAAAVAVLGLE